MSFSFKIHELFDPKRFDHDIDWPWAYGTEDADVIKSDSEPGDDIYFSILYGFGGNDELIGGDRPDALYGGEGKDRLDGGDGDDHLFGGEGDDHLIGGRGADALHGEGGEDTASYADSGAGVMVDLGAGRGYAGDADGDRLYGIENVLGSAHRDFIWGDNADNWLRGGGGDDQLFGYGGEDRIWGEAGDDLLFGGADNDIITGGTGVDTLLGEAGNDSLLGGADDDRLIGGAGDDDLHGGEGADSHEGGTGVDTAWYHLTHASEEIDVDLGGTGARGVAEGDTYSEIENAYIENGANHTLIGDDNDNVLTLGANNGSRVEGRGGDDVIELYWSGGNDIDGGGDTDSVHFHNGVDMDVDLGNGWARQSGYADDSLSRIENVRTSSGNDEIFGSNGDNELHADWGDDVLDGRDGNDLLFGGDGDDRLNGNDGNDTLTGGRDSDTFVFINDTSSAEFDVVTDFEVGIDQLDFSNNINRVDNYAEFLQYSMQDGANVVIDTGQGSITLENVQLTDLTPSDFVF